MNAWRNLFRSAAWTAILTVTCEAGSSSAIAAESTSQTNTLEEIVVTSQRRAENVQKSPVAVTALSGDTLQGRGVDNIADLQGLVPATQFQPNQNNTMNVEIRGITTNNVFPLADAAVSYNYDDTSILHPANFPAGLFDVERVEVLRGPQGTLYGRNSTAGAVNILTKQPTDQFEGEIEGTVGDYGLLGIDGVVNVPITNGIATRTVVQHTQHDGYTSDGFNDQDTTGVRENIRIAPSDDWALLIGADFSSSGGRGAAFSLCPPGSAATDTSCQGYPWRPWSGNAPGVRGFEGDYLDMKNFGIHAEMTWDLPFATLTYIPAFRSLSDQALGLGDTAGPLPVYGFRYGILGIDTTKDDDFGNTQELRLSSRANADLKWVAGFFYMHDRLVNENLSDVDSPFLGAGGTDIHPFAREDGHYLSESYAGFGQATYPVVDWLRLTGGIRYTYDTKDSTGSTYEISPVGTNLVPDAGQQRYYNLSWKAGVDADVASDSLLYATISSGYKSGGFNGGLPPNTYPPEKIMAYEIGSKNRFFDQSLEVNLSAFYYDYDNYQYQYFGTVDGPSGPVQQTIVAPARRARIDGVELESAWQVAPTDRITASVSYLDAKFTQFSLGGIDYSGERLPFAPLFSFTAAYEHTFRLPWDADVVFHVSTLADTPQWTYYAQIRAARQAAYTSTDLILDYVPGNGKWEASFWVRNLEDDDHVTAFIEGSAISSTAALTSPPRTVGATLRYFF